MCVDTPTLCACIDLWEEQKVWKWVSFLDFFYETVKTFTVILTEWVTFHLLKKGMIFSFSAVGEHKSLFSSGKISSSFELGDVGSVSGFAT